MSVLVSEPMIYACPVCKRLVRREELVFRCPTCSQAYPIRESIPDFILEELSRSTDPELRRMRFIDRMAHIYESRFWYPIVLNLYGGFRSPSLAQLIGTVAQKVQSTKGRVIDIACGPGTYGRRIASPTKEVFGIDVSMGCCGKVQLTLQRKAFPMCISPVREWRLSHSQIAFSMPLCVVAHFISLPIP